MPVPSAVKQTSCWRDPRELPRAAQTRREDLLREQVAPERQWTAWRVPAAWTLPGNRNPEITESSGRGAPAAVLSVESAAPQSGRWGRSSLLPLKLVSPDPSLHDILVGGFANHVSVLRTTVLARFKHWPGRLGG